MVRSTFTDAHMQSLTEGDETKEACKDGRSARRGCMIPVQEGLHDSQRQLLTIVEEKRPGPYVCQLRNRAIQFFPTLMTIVLSFCGAF